MECNCLKCNCLKHYNVKDILFYFSINSLMMNVLAYKIFHYLNNVKQCFMHFYDNCKLYSMPFTNVEKLFGIKRNPQILHASQKNVHQSLLQVATVLHLIPLYIYGRIQPKRGQFCQRIYCRSKCSWIICKTVATAERVIENLFVNYRKKYQ